MPQMKYFDEVSQTWKPLAPTQIEFDTFKDETIRLSAETAKKTDLVATNNTVSILQADKADKSEVNTLASGKADKIELAVEKARIDSFTKLTAGSTTGDAELIDGRIGADGVIHNNLGEASRTQFKKLNENIFKTIKLLTDVRWVLKHIDVTGIIVVNANKNVVTEDMHLLKSDTTITVDENYKFQISLYNKITKAFIKRITWLQGGYVYKLDDDYYVRVEISDKLETIQTDTSISSHVNVFYSESLMQKNLEDTQKNSNDIKKLNEQMVNQVDSLVNVLGIDTFKRKQLTITDKNRYSAWPMTTSLNSKLYCIYTRVGYHEDYSSSEIYLKTSNNGVIWSDEKILINNSSGRASVTGIGVVNNKVSFWVRLGSKYELYSLDNNNDALKISTLTPDFSYGHISNIINVPTVGLMAFYNTFETNRRWGVFVSVDNGIKWTQKNIEIPTSNSECPTEISGAYLKDGKILAVGRKDIEGNAKAQFQIQSSDYGTIWTKKYTNITDIALSTPSIIYNANTNEISNYYFQRGTALRVRKNNASDIWDNPTNWTNSEILANTGGHMEDEGNVNVVEYKDHHIATYYSGNANYTGIYAVIVEQ